MPGVDHVAVSVSDLESVRAFYERYLGAEAGPLYHNPSTGLRSYFLSFGDGARLEIMTRPGTTEPALPQQLGWAHTAFSLGSREAVDALVEVLRTDGFTVVDGPRVTGDGYYEASVLDPEGNRVELMA
jgi:lactoylglutathione lyase